MLWRDTTCWRTTSTTGRNAILRICWPLMPQPPPLSSWHASHRHTWGIYNLNLYWNIFIYYTNYHYNGHFFLTALGHLFFFLTCLFLHSMANASVLPGELQRENTEDVLQGERLSDADICPPLPTPAPPVTERGEWGEGDNASKRKQTAPIIRKVRGISSYPAVLWRVWPVFWYCFLPVFFFFISTRFPPVLRKSECSIFWSFVSGGEHGWAEPQPRQPQPKKRLSAELS